MSALSGLTGEARWRAIYQTRSGSSTCDDPRWLLAGCPSCGAAPGDFDVTDDCWAYCRACSKGFSTAYPFTGYLLARLLPDLTSTPLGDDDDHP